MVKVRQGKPIQKEVNGGFDHGVGHSHQLLYDAKAPNRQKSNEFNGLGHYLSNIALDSF
jgi:hypothetical protein